MNKLELNIDSTSLGDSACILKFKRKVLGDLTNGIPDPQGGYKSLPNASMVYGVALHKFVDVMYKTAGHYPTARKEAESLFLRIKKLPPSKGKDYLAYPKHLITSCYNLWTNYIEPDPNFEVLMVSTKCYWCDGEGVDKALHCLSNITCSHCSGNGTVEGPATEITFRIPFYEDDFVCIYLCGTIDRVGQFKGGCFAIRDWKSTSSYNKDEYLSSYELSRQLRIYTLACKLESIRHPDSILGRIGATNMGACIDGVFIKSNANDNEYQMSEVFQYSKQDISDFQYQLSNFCVDFAQALRNNSFPKQGILNGSCDAKWGKCEFWNVCKSNEQVAQLLLKRDFERKFYNPLAFNE